jgi:hypothetical protein
LLPEMAKVDAEMENKLNLRTWLYEGSEMTN